MPPPGLMQPFVRSLYVRPLVVIPELRFLEGTDGRRESPADPENCSVYLCAGIGPKGARGEELFEFQVRTPDRLESLGKVPNWSRGLLLIESFSWSGVETQLKALLDQCRGQSWIEVAGLIGRYLKSEYEGYTRDQDAA